jgi:hypothetical protein
MLLEGTKNMIRRSLSCNWTEEDRRTRAKWMRAMAVFYGCVALFIFGLIVLTKPPSVALNHQTRSADLQGDRIDRNTHVSGKAR